MKKTRYELSTAVERFNRHLGEGYSEMIAEAGMCWYWARWYKSYLSLLGFKPRVVGIGENEDNAHVWVEVGTKEGVFALDRLCCTSSAEYRDKHRALYIADFRSKPQFYINPDLDSDLGRWLAPVPKSLDTAMFTLGTQLAKCCDGGIPPFNLLFEDDFSRRFITGGVS